MPKDRESGQASDLWLEAHVACNGSRDDMWDWLEDRYWNVFEQYESLRVHEERLATLFAETERERLFLKERVANLVEQLETLRELLKRNREAWEATVHELGAMKEQLEALQAWADRRPSSDYPQDSRLWKAWAVTYPATKASEEETTAASDGTEPGTPGHGSAERLSRPATSSSEASVPHGEAKSGTAASESFDDYDYRMAGVPDE